MRVKSIIESGFVYLTGHSSRLQSFHKTLTVEKIFFEYRGYGLTKEERLDLLSKIKRTLYCWEIDFSIDKRSYTIPLSECDIRSARVYLRQARGNKVPKIAGRKYDV